MLSFRLRLSNRGGEGGPRNIERRERAKKLAMMWRKKESSSAIET